MHRSGRVAKLEGMRFGRLTVLSFAGVDSKRKASTWMVQCDCGSAPIVVLCTALTTGDRVSCGCRRAETLVAWKTVNARHGAKANRKTNGTYSTWQGMKDRCHNPMSQAFSYYGGRGIVVCDRWRDDFQAFLADMGVRPRGMTIDRIDVNGNYEPSNCRWATDIEQARNRRSNRVITWRGETMTLIEWAARLSVNYDALRYRLDEGWPLDEAFTRPFKPRRIPG